METLDPHFRKLADAAFRRHGFAQVDLASHWLAIVGAEVARYSQPEQIKWPRGSVSEKHSTGGTLVIRATAGRGLDVQYEASAIIERINQFFGYQAIAAVKVVQAQFRPESHGQPEATAPPAPDFSAHLMAIADPALKDALARLGAGVFSPKNRSPQAK